jgi:type IV pilus assembly protein PilY1
VNAFNSLELSDELYYSVFKPSKNLSWDGNVKQYKMGTHNEEFAVVDAKNKPAIDPDSGYFAEGALSIWTPETDYPNGDGAIVTDGGLAHHLPSSRTVYTSDNSGLVNLSPATASKTQLGISTKDAEFHQKLIDWGLGKDAFDADNDGDVNESRRRMQDPLHSEPTIITYYKERAQNPGQTDTIDRTMFIGTNGGFLHAFNIDKENPTEHFSFIPKELLHNLELYHSGGGILATKAYGIDGPVTHWHKDANGNKIVDNGEKVYVYFSLRRGGHSYYALDVSDRSAPKLLWEKHGPYPTDFPNKPVVSTGYENLGQTWSRMEPATVKWNGADRVVLFASGGYDPVEDGDMASGNHRTGPLSRTAHTVGTTIYMIDALTGDVLWDAKKHSGVGSQMTSSFPAHVAPVDIKGNGYADIVFASDVGGRIWRFDIDTQAKGSADFASGRIVADLYEGAGPGNRRFYNEVDVIGSQDNDQIFLSIGSGNRSHPGTYGAAAAQNHHYIIKDTLTAPQSPSIVTQADLAAFPAASDYGWYVPMVHPGEKVLARSNTVGDQVLFSTFSPKISATPTCDASPGYSRAYKLDLYHGIMQMAQTQSGGIPPMPMLIPPKRKGKETCTVAGVCEPTPPPSSDQEYSVLVGTEVVKFEDPVRSPYGSIFKDYWLERQQ